MAVTLGSAFVSGTTLAGGGDFASVGRRSCKRTHFRVAAEGVSTTRPGSADNLSKRGRGGEIPSMIESGMEKPRTLWWAPLFHVSADDQWANLLGESGTGKVTGREQPPSTPVPAKASLPEVIEAASAEKRSRQRATKAAFTAEKARALRKSMREGETWHGGWYHSPTASRLAEPTD